MSEEKKETTKLPDTLLTELHDLVDKYRGKSISKSEVIGVVTMFKMDILMEDYPADNTV